ncbi:hypothetical protein NLJ89_g5669 [Agrocybe chaxingu]|uniref:Uncharacterized protein n=1 Tax=Agrocybe chaxingu TaxID=84603 RepID=A0A9W8K6X6_9AGAR|nr:hypothetical protein NLJ89_g5669 [Agrocybe chaxingu]
MTLLIPPCSVFLKQTYLSAIFTSDILRQTCQFQPCSETRSLPSVPQSLSEICEQAIQDFLRNGHKFHKYGSGLDIESRELTGGSPIAAYCTSEIGSLCTKISSKLILHPDLQKWHSAFSFHNSVDKDSNNFLAESWLQIKYNASADSLSIPEDFNANLDEHTKDRLKALAIKFPKLASWEMFSNRWETFKTPGPRASCNAPRSADAMDGILRSMLPNTDSRGRSSMVVSGIDPHNILGILSATCLDLEVALPSGDCACHNVIVKLTFSEEQTEKLRHEYGIYASLSRKTGVKGVMAVHGLFEDLETGTLVLIMERGGQNLRKREEDPVTQNKSRVLFFPRRPLRIYPELGSMRKTVTSYYHERTKFKDNPAGD